MEPNAMSQASNTDPRKPDGDNPVDPDVLMGGINKLSFFAMLLVSLIVHAVLIGATSVEFIQQCVKYQTLEPGAKVREEARIKRTEERKKKLAERQAEDAKKVAQQKDKGTNGSNGGKPTSKPASKIEQDINPKTTTLPAKSGVNLDDIDEL